uniref:Ion_trans_2 domain-containing protein n=1 Tax=Macrostomum lignano TaxID=282301 RepID=A0A1I8IKR0_9PLAT
FNFLRAIRLAAIKEVLISFNLISSATSKSLISLIIGMICFWSTLAGLIHLVENLDNFWTFMGPRVFEPCKALDFFNSFYMLIITASTVGYGDIYPKTTLGQLTIMICIVVAGTYFLTSVPALISLYLENRINKKSNFCTGIGQRKSHKFSIGNSKSHKFSIGNSKSHKFSIGNSKSHKFSIGNSKSHKFSIGNSKSHKFSIGNSKSHKFSIGNSKIGNSKSHKFSIGNSKSHKSSIGNSKSHKFSIGNILTGAIESGTASAFLSDFYNPTRWNGSININAHLKCCALYSGTLPSVTQWLFHGMTGRVRTIRGSCVNPRDLTDVKAYSANAIVILSQLLPADKNEDDYDNYMRAMTVKLNFPDFSYYYLTGWRNKSAYNSLWDLDTVICNDQIVNGLMGMNCMAPGFSTLIINLLCSTEVEKTDLFQQYKWRSFYNFGLTATFHCARFTRSFRGMSFKAACAIIYDRWGIILLGVSVDQANCNYSSTIINPSCDPDFVINPSIMKAFVICKDPKDLNRFETYCNYCKNKADGICTCDGNAASEIVPKTEAVQRSVAEKLLRDKQMRKNALFSKNNPELVGLELCDSKKEGKNQKEASDLNIYHRWEEIALRPNCVGDRQLEEKFRHDIEEGRGDPALGIMSTHHGALSATDTWRYERSRRPIADISSTCTGRRTGAAASLTSMCRGQLRDVVVLGDADWRASSGNTEIFAKSTLFGAPGSPTSQLRPRRVLTVVLATRRNSGERVQEVGLADNFRPKEEASGRFVYTFPSRRTVVDVSDKVTGSKTDLENDRLNKKYFSGSLSNASNPVKDGDEYDATPDNSFNFVSPYDPDDEQLMAGRAVRSAAIEFFKRSTSTALIGLARRSSAAIACRHFLKKILQLPEEDGGRHPSTGDSSSTPTTGEGVWQRVNSSSRNSLPTKLPQQILEATAAATADSRGVPSGSAAVGAEKCSRTSGSVEFTIRESSI